MRKTIAFNYYGGKYSRLDELYFNFPLGFDHLVDVFGGSFCVSLNFSGKIIKTANEINEDITNFFRVLRDHEQELMRKLYLTPCSKKEFENCFLETEDNIEKARRFYVRVRQSFFGLGSQRKNKGWHMAKGKANVKGGETLSKWNNSLEKLHLVAELIRSNFQISNFSYKTCIDETDAIDTFFYCDPPYSKKSRKSYKDYRFEFSEQDHQELATKLHHIQGKAMISGYDCTLMNELYKDWRKVYLKKKQNSLRTREVQEVIWMNYKEENKGLF